ncbi:uncharacterized protein LOC141640904 [Silene latifolia]|uniref:uncharacterized protein LOC141640904 n=1 Tax=Silene latifolia TaxID=37657 RepID=UPI003D76C247
MEVLPCNWKRKEMKLSIRSYQEAAFNRNAGIAYIQPHGENDVRKFEQWVAVKHSECSVLGKPPEPGDPNPPLNSTCPGVLYPNRYDVLAILPADELVDEVLNFLKTNKIDVLGLLETRVKINKSTRLLRTKFGRFHHFCNYNSHYNGRIWLLWDSSTTLVTIIQAHAQFIHCHIHHLITSRKFHLFVVYGSNSASVRSDLWSRLSSLAAQVGPWVVMGDFNIIRSPRRRSATLLLNLLLLVSSTLVCLLVDLMIYLVFDQTTACFLPPGISDHCPAVLSFYGDPLAKKQFRFLNCWIDHPEYRNLVSSAWCTKVTDLRIKQKREELEQCFRNLQLDPLSKDFITKEKSISLEFWNLKNTEAKILIQIAKLRDIKQGDICSKCFFAKNKERQQRQYISEIQGISGQRHCGIPDVGKTFVEYYTQLLGSSQPVMPVDPSIFSGGPCLDDKAKEILTIPIFREEIKASLFSIHTNKSPELDGFSAGFFKSVWDIIEEDFCTAIEDFFITSFMPKQANVTLIYLIPKKKIVQSVKDFRIISCFSIIYKTISKILTNRLQRVIPQLVGEGTGCFS